MTTNKGPTDDDGSPRPQSPPTLAMLAVDLNARGHGGLRGWLPDYGRDRFTGPLGAVLSRADAEKAVRGRRSGGVVEAETVELEQGEA